MLKSSVRWHLVCLILIAGSTCPAAAVPAQWKPLQQVFGVSPKMLKGGVAEVDLPRIDIHATLRGTAIKPSFDETDLRFTRMGGKTMVMGELALLEAEVNPVLSRLEARGFTVTALHNHLLEIRPLIVFIHFMGTGTTSGLASSIRYALGASGTPMRKATEEQPSGTIDTAAINRIFGAKGDMSDGVFNISIERRETIRNMGRTVPPEMGVETELTFQPTGKGAAAVTGEIVLVASEVNPVAASLRKSGIMVTAMHNHMLTEQPRLFWLHFFAHGNAVTIARELRIALSRTNSRLSKR